MAPAGGQIVAKALADGAPVTLFPEIRHYVVLHPVAELVPDHHGILGIGDAAAAQLQPALERIVEGVVLIAGLCVYVEGPGDEPAKAQLLDVALGQVKVVIGVDVGKAPIVPGQPECLRVITAERCGIGLHAAVQHVRLIQAAGNGILHRFVGQHVAGGG